MTKENSVQLFDNKKVRTVWDSEQEKWFISIIDVVEILTESPNARKYWSVLKTRLKKEGSQLATNWAQTWGIGQAKEDNGVIILVAKAERKIAINPGYGLEDRLTAGLGGEIIRNIITPEFKDYKDGKLKMISFFAKKARGLMVRYIIDTNAETIDDLKAFNYEGYAFDANLSSGNKLVFTR